MKKLFVALLFVVATSIGVSFGQTVSKAMVKVGDDAPDFTVEMVDGTQVKLSELKGKVVLINFWATWCPPCRAEFKRIPAEIVEKFAKEKFVLLAISRKEAKEDVMKFREDNGYTFSMGLDPESKIFDKYATSGIPRNFLIDQKGKIVAAEVGYTPESFDELIKKIEETLKPK